MAAVRLEPLDPTAPGIVMATMLADSAGVPHASALVSVGDAIQVEGDEAFLRGHGTMMASDEGEARLTATMCGVVQRLNKLVMVRAYKSRYAPEIGDVVVGRVDELQTRRWAVDIGSRPQSSLQLSAVDLPGGVQRRRTAEDELVMRAVFREGDVLAAEVQQVHKFDNSIALHMRSAKYCKLRHGQLVCVPPQLIRRAASHFVDLDEAGVRLVIGCNGWIWVGVAARRRDAVASASAPRDSGDHATPVNDGPAAEVEADAAQWEQCARFAAAARALAKLSLPVFRASLERVVQAAAEQGIACRDMLGMDFLTVVVSLEQARRGVMDTGDG